ncbi:MAG: prepilin peptidase [Rhodoferax sp.]
MTFNFTPASWQLWCFATLALVMLMAIDMDQRERRIPNVLVVLTLVAGVVLHALGPANERAGLFSAFPGALGAGQALLGVLTGLLVFLPFYFVGAMGAGDVKFMAALGAFTGPWDAVGLALTVLVAGGVLALLRMLMKRNSRLVLGNVMVVLGGLGRGGPRAFDPVTQSADRMPYAFAFALGLAAYGYVRLSGIA